MLVTKKDREKKHPAFILSATFRFIEASLYCNEVSLLFSVLQMKKMRLREVKILPKSTLLVKVTSHD